ncbi:MAG: protein translocase subunit SecDF [Chlorobi bacterium]|nr:protein translocase subunit SecDF [Chlorobiota bacterium]
MQNKGFIKVFAIALALVSIYQLSFTYYANKVQKDAKEYANGDKKLERVYLDSIENEPVYNFIGLRKFTYSECKDRELNLGLDLKGGMNVTLEVSVVDVIKSLANYSKDTTFIDAINLAKKMQKNSQEDFVDLFGRAFEQIDPNGRLAAIFNTIELKDRINYNSTNEEVLNIIRTETESAIDNSFNILRSRIDRFGVAQPNIQSLEQKSRILVELPGIKDPERVRKLLQGTANLEFWETYENSEIYQYLLEANTKIKEIEEAEKALNKDKKEETQKNEEVKKEETKKITENLTEKVSKEDKDTSGISLLDKIESDSLNVDSLNATQNLLKDYPLFSVLQPRVSRDGKQLLQGAAIGYSHKKDTAKVNAYLNIKQVKALFPRNLKLLWSAKPIDEAGNFFELVAIKITSRDGRAALDGNVITNARAEFGQNQASAEVSLSMNGEGAKIWARLTKENVGRQIAIVLDNYVRSHPVVNQEIKGGRSSISGGGMDIKEAKDLANILKSGKLPAPAKIIEEAIVGPSLGHEAIRSGLISFVIAFIVVLIYMVFYYNHAGWVANVALLTNIFFIIGVLASLGAVLTLPGIAGIILTIGMSVDANVLIYERIREELKAGKGYKLAINDGYQNAYSAIIDANITTLLTAIILYYFGKGPIQGFATTLGIGILSSLFTAIFITRLIFIGFMKKNRVLKFDTSLTRNFFKNTHIDFIGMRKFFYGLSIIIIVIGLFSLVTRGLNKGVDFVGGRNYLVRFEQPVNTNQLQELLKNVYGEAPEVKIFGNNNQVKITTKYMINSEALDADDQVEELLYEGLKPVLGDKVTYQNFKDNYRMSSQKVGPTIADDIKDSAYYAVFFSLLVIFLYILLRFKNWQFGMGAILALMHDVLIIIGLFSLLYSVLPFSLEVDQAFIAAILTVVGYSINDTVVVFDRIREYIALYKKRERKEIMNSALNSTLSRTFNTSMSTFVVLLTIFILGGETIRGFIFALMIGVVVGTYSSLFIASPIVYDTVKKDETSRVLKGKRRR